MEVVTNKENVCINKLISEKSELFFVEEDMIVPDSKPDILSTINLNGNVCIYKKEITNEKLKLEGSINTYIMYLPDSQNDKIRGLNANVDFSHTFSIPDATDDMNVVVNMQIKSLECKVLNGRKISVRAGIEANIKLYGYENVDIIKEINNIEGIQVLEENYVINSLVGNGSTKSYVKDSLIANEQDEILEILNAKINLVNNDIKISFNKVISKCDVEIKLLYLTQDNRIEVLEGKIPAVGFIDIQNISEDNICDIKNYIKNILIRPTEEHSIYVELELETMCSCYEKKEINVIKDIYSPVENLNFTQRKITTAGEKVTETKDFTITSKINIPELIDGNLINVEISAMVNKEKKQEMQIEYEGELLLNFIYSQSNLSIGSKASKIPFDFSINNPLQSEEICIDSSNSIINKTFSVKQNGDVECNIDMEFVDEFYENVELNIIENIEKVEATEKAKNNYNSLIIYIVQPGDSLWKIAKKFRSTVEEIAIVNEIENRDKINIGDKLYIPKFSYSG